MKTTSTTPLVESLRAQFDAAWSLLRETIDTFSRESWCAGGSEAIIPARLVWHAIETVDFYLRDDPRSFTIGGRFGGDWQDLPRSSLPTQDVLRDYLEDVRRQASDWIGSLGDEELLGEDRIFGREGMRHLDRALYVLRHTHQHLGELAAELRRRGRPRPKWR